jgi:hypothetical protein
MRLMADPEHLRRDAGRVRVAELLERLDLVDAARRPASTYSGGMRRRLELAMTLVGSPRVIFPRGAHNRPRSAQPPHHVGFDEDDQLADRIAVLDPRPNRRAGNRGRAQAPHPGPRPAAVRHRRDGARRRRLLESCGPPTRTGSSWRCSATATCWRCGGCSSNSVKTATGNDPARSPETVQVRPDPSSATSRSHARQFLIGKEIPENPWTTASPTPSRCATS